MRNTLHSVCFLLFTAVVSPVHGEDSGLAELFSHRTINGTMVISSLDGATSYTHNDDRANTRFVPASTFKIPNTLIALEEGAVADEKQIIQWDGKDRGLPAWNRDQSLETAFPSSCVWFYQELAKRVGKAKYASNLHSRQVVVTSVGQAFQQHKPSCMGVTEGLFCW